MSDEKSQEKSAIPSISDSKLIRADIEKFRDSGYVHLAYFLCEILLDNSPREEISNAER